MYETEVTKGAAWLDQNAPGWYDKADINTLDMSVCDTCILGAVFGAKSSFTLNADMTFAVEHGFSLWLAHNQDNRKENERKYRLLAATWIREILRRRAADRMTKKAVESQAPIQARPIV